MAERERLRACVGEGRGNAGDGAVAAPVRRNADSVLSRYELGEMIGRGRLGSLVYRGTHRALGVPVAIRLLRREEQPNWDAVRARFLVEARTLQVPHDNLLQVRDYGEDDRLVYIVTDYIEGSEPPTGAGAGGEDAVAAHRRAVASDARGHGDAERARRVHRRRQSGHDPPRRTTSGGVGPAERLVLTTAGISSVQDVLATMREQELRGEEANEQELPYVAPEVLMGRAPEPPADVFTTGGARVSDGDRRAAVPRADVARADRADAADHAGTGAVTRDGRAGGRRLT